MKYLLFVFAVIFTSLLLNTFTVNASSLEEEPETIDMPSIPKTITNPRERADYLIIHYWDQLDFEDVLQTRNQRLMEQSFVNFLSVFPFATSDSIISYGFDILLNRAKIDNQTFNMLTELAEDYLFDSESPMRSESHYISYLTALARFNDLPEIQKARIDDRLEMISKNRQGSRATDFRFSKINGEESTLYKNLPDAGSRLILIFFDPECGNCDEILERLESSETISYLIKEGKLNILAIYAGDNYSAWERKASLLPNEWTVGINEKEIDDGDLYFLPVMPTIYILDSKGLVMEKDVNINNISFLNY